MSIEHQTALSIIDLKPAIQPRKHRRIWLVMIGAIMGAGIQLGVTAAIHHVDAEHRRLAVKHHRENVLAMWRAHHAAPATCRYTVHRN